MMPTNSPGSIFTLMSSNTGAPVFLKYRKDTFRNSMLPFSTWQSRLEAFSSLISGTVFITSLRRRLEAAALVPCRKMFARKFSAVSTWER